MDCCDIVCPPVTASCIPIRRFSPYCRLVEVSPAAPQTYFLVGTSLRNPSVANFNNTGVYLELRRKGCENLIATYPVWRRDEHGAIGFYFDDNFFSQAPGYYIGDIYFNCSYCLSVQLYLAPCQAVVFDCYAAPVMDAGIAPCDLFPSVGLESIGGLECLPASVPAPACGPVPPFYPLINPPVPPSPPPPDPPVPPTVPCVGAGSIGM